MITITELEDGLKVVETKYLSNNAQYIKGVLHTYGIPDATISRTNFSEKSLAKGIQIGRQAFFIVGNNAQTVVSDTQGKMGKKISVRFIIGMDESNIFAMDVEANENIFFAKNDLHNNADFFLPLCGREKNTVTAEERIDSKIGARMARVFNKLKILNEGAPEEVILEFLINYILLSAINAAYAICQGGELFRYMENRTLPDGSDFYKCVREIMDAVSGKIKVPQIEMVDSRLFNNASYPLQFDGDVRDNLLELASMPWLSTNSDYLGQIMQSIIIEKSGVMTENYTTSENVFKVINPMFMDAFKAEFDSADSDKELLRQLEAKIINTFIFDPSCSAGEFLVTVWEAMNNLLRAIGEKTGNHMQYPMNHLYGISESEKSQKVALLNMFFTSLRNHSTNTKDGVLEAVDCLYNSNIIMAKSLLTDWNTFCNVSGVVYVCGNWPYAGARKLKKQKSELNAVFAGIKNHGDIDLAGAYFLKAVRYLKNHEGEIAFITTNSLTQGKQIGQLWPVIYANDVHIRFAYQAFKWNNDARNKTAVTVVILGIAKNSNKSNCFLYKSDDDGKPIKHLVTAISPYLVPGDKMVMERRSPISSILPKMVKGNMPYGAEFFSFTPEERKEALAAYPEMDKYLRVWIGADEMLGGKERYCLWIHDEDIVEARKIPLINERLIKCKEDRANKKDKNARKLASRPHSFREQNETHTQSVVLPQLSSENYAFIPIDIYGPEAILTNLAFVVYDCDYWIFGVLASTMHNIWIRTVCGGFETRIRYSESLGYNTFPFPHITEAQKQAIRDCVDDIMIAREAEYGKSLGAMYKKGKMSDALVQAHLRLDQVIDSCYRKETFIDEQDRIYFLFNLYEKMMGGKR